MLPTLRIFMALLVFGKNLVAFTLATLFPFLAEIYKEDCLGVRSEKIRVVKVVE